MKNSPIYIKPKEWHHYHIDSKGIVYPQTTRFDLITQEDSHEHCMDDTYPKPY